jgi:UDP-N-acetylmuramate--alanine ligase
MTEKYHLIGIGGIGMSGIAHLLLAKGIAVSGSDIKESAITKRLSDAGAQIFIGHKAENIGNATIAVFSSAINPENPEVKEVVRLGIPLIKRAEALTRLMKDKTVITVAGSHGKTTTTSLVSYMLLEAGLYPTAAIGGILRNISTNACSGEGRLFVAEADESDGSFLYYNPDYSIITNIDREHLDYYDSFDKEIEAFRQFIARTEPKGCVFLCSDDDNLKKLARESKIEHLLFGLKDGADITAKDIRLFGLSSEFDCHYRKVNIGRFHLALGGEHNISNALSVIALGVKLGLDFEVIKKALSQYKGAGRRLEIKYESDALMVIDDYAHHPTEIRATLAAIRNLKKKRVIAVFQPHRFSRTKFLLDEFGGSFTDTDCLILTEIYPASEVPIPDVSGRNIYDLIKKNHPEKDAHFLIKYEINDHLLKMIKPGDLVVFLGAGDIIKTCDEFVEKIKS